VTKTLTPPDGKPRLLTATTTAKLAARVRCATQIATDLLPPGFRDLVPLDILLALHVAEENADYLNATELKPAGLPGSQVTIRWLLALEQEGLVERRQELLALSTQGNTLVCNMLELIYDAQRSLD
jgi:hypothetical protein